MFFDDPLDIGGQGLDLGRAGKQTGSAGESGHDEIVQRKGNRKQEPGHNPWHYFGYQNLSHGLSRGAAQI